ncbi:endoglucanase-like [Cylas formicarius]|uniref:endoglucanase-like n=1 Tax=Cylas formicarius TaxID=197179 RepID=UPI002958694D|nr:endoglucanase-like [Cylas formicarius]
MLLTIGLFLIAAFEAFNCQSSPEITPIEGGFNGTGITTLYWDCCKVSCAWFVESTNVKSPVQACEVDGITPIDFNAQSGCAEEGSSFTCNSQQPWIVNDTLAYGFTAASFTGGADTSNCCRCVLLSFLGQLQGKQMLLQITNTGGDLFENHFDIAIPGGGVGLFNLGCIRQWNAPENGWGARYGGISTLSECDDLPEQLQDGCRVRFNFLEGYDNPNVTFTEVQCPSELTAITGCVSDVQN